MYATHVHGETGREYNLQPVSEFTMARNITFSVADCIALPTHFQVILLNVRKLMQSDLAPMFGKDWRHRAVNSVYISRDKTLIEPLSSSSDHSAKPSFPSSLKPEPTMSPPGTPTATPTSKPTFTRGTYPRFATSVPGSQSPKTPTSPSLASSFESLNLNDYSQPPNFRSATRQDPLPSDIIELLTSLSASPETLAQVSRVFNDVARSLQEAELIKCGFNHGTAKALSYLMKNPSQ